MVDPNEEVKLYWDGCPRGEVRAIYQQNDGAIVIAGEWDGPGGYNYNSALGYGMADILFHT